MRRPHVKDLVTWLCSVPASIVLTVCLFLPQVKDCDGTVKTPFDTGTAPMIIALAIIGVLPVLWRLLPARRQLFRRFTNEELVALCCFTVVVCFVTIFPIVMMFGDWRRGAELTWAAGWLLLYGTLWWAVTANR